MQYWINPEMDFRQRCRLESVMSKRRFFNEKNMSFRELILSFQKIDKRSYNDDKPVFRINGFDVPKLLYENILFDWNTEKEYIDPYKDRFFSNVLKVEHKIKSFERYVKQFFMESFIFNIGGDGLSPRSEVLERGEHWIRVRTPYLKKGEWVFIIAYKSFYDCFGYSEYELDLYLDYINLKK